MEEGENGCGRLGLKTVSVVLHPRTVNHKHTSMCMYMADSLHVFMYKHNIMCGYNTQVTCSMEYVSVCVLPHPPPMFPR